MGAWHIAIDGHGVHDNGLPHDAEQRVKEFVDQLIVDGHTVHSASITIGSAREYVPMSDKHSGFYRELPALPRVEAPSATSTGHERAVGGVVSAGPYSLEERA